MGAANPPKPRILFTLQLKNRKKFKKTFVRNIQSKAKERARRVRKSKHFVPLTVGLTILVCGFLLQYNQVIAANIMAYISPGNSEVTEITEIDPTVAIAVHDKSDFNDSEIEY